MVTVTTSTTSSNSTVNGIASGIDTTSLINAIMAQKGTGVARLQAQQTLNNQKTTALATMKTELGALITSMAALQDTFNSRTVTSSDSSDTYVDATANGAVTGSYDLTVNTVATKGRVSANLDASGSTTNLSVANPTDAVNSGIFTAGAPATFAVQGTDGKVYQIALDDSSNTLNGLRDKINSVAGASVTASVVNTGKGAKPYQLVITAKNTGTGSTQGVVTIADITNMQSDGTAGAAANNLGIGGGGSSDGLVGNLTGGLSSTTAGATATDANFTLNGINLTRSSNTVKDAVDGMAFTIKQGGQKGTTTLTVAQDTAGTTAALQDYITKYNKLEADYKTASTATQNTDGSIALAPLSQDSATRSLMNTLKGTMAGLSSGVPSSSSYKTWSSLGVTNQADGSLYLNTYTFQQAMNNDPASVQSLFAFSGTSNNSAVSVQSGGPATATGSVDFTITKDGSGTLWGTLTQNNVTSAPIQVSNGTLVGTGAYAGLNLNVTGTGSGTLTLSRGAGQATSDLMAAFTGTTGGMATLLSNINKQNANLAAQITQGQTILDQEKANLQNQFAQMEAIVGQMKATQGTLLSS